MAFGQGLQAKILNLSCESDERIFNTLSAYRTRAFPKPGADPWA